MMRTHKVTQAKAGFTLIELLLAMSFISVLLIAIVLTAVQAGSMYNRGMTLRALNVVGRSVGDTLRRDFVQTDGRQISGNSTNSVISIMSGGKAVGGRVCLGGVSYLWNYPVPAGTTVPTTELVKSASGETINFVRIIDESGSYCIPDPSVGYKNKMTLPPDNLVTQILKTQTAGEVVQALYSMRISTIARDVNSPEGLYKIEYTIGTNKTDEIQTADQTCRAPNDSSQNIEFCAINKFETIVRTNG